MRDKTAVNFFSELEKSTANLIFNFSKAIQFHMINTLRNEENTAAIRFIEGDHCHSDTAEMLRNPGLRIPGVVADFSLGQKPFPAIGLHYQKNYFALARGMQFVTLRLPQDHASLLVSYGAFLEEAIGYSAWVSFCPFKLRIDMDVWVEEAFSYSCR